MSETDRYILSDEQHLLDQYHDACATAKQFRDQEKQRPTKTALQRLMADLGSEKRFHERCMNAAERVLSVLQKKLGLALLLLIFGATAANAQNAIGPWQKVRDNAVRSVAITPSDSVPIQATSALFVGGSVACNITMKLFSDGSAVLWSNVQPGQILPISAVLILSTGTTCAGIVALYDTAS